MSTKSAAEAVSSGTPEKQNANRWWAVALVVVAAGVLSAFYGINEYASGTGAIVKAANGNHGRFEAVFRDLKDARFRALNLAAATLLQSRVTVEAFAKDDREALVARMEPFFETLQKSHGIEQLNFWTAPAKVYYRAGSPTQFGMDLSTYRKSIVAANERRSAISAIETGLGGLIGLRAITPVTVEGKFIGVIEFVSSFKIPLERASETSGLKWALSLNKETSERVERPIDQKNDAWQANDVYFTFSDPATGQTLRDIKFDPRSKDHVLAKAGGQTFYVKTFPVVNFSGVPTITVATLLDVTEPFAEVFRSAAIKASILFLLASILGSVAIIKFAQIKAQFGGTLSRQRKELEERAFACDAALSKLRDVDLIKRGFFTNLVTAVNEPLQAVAGQLKTLPAELERTGASSEVVDRLHFALTETTRLSLLVEDYRQIEMFRQKLVKGDNPSISLATVVDQALAEDLALYRRIPQLVIKAEVPKDLPATRGDADLMRRAITGLVGFAAQRTGRGRITLAGALDDAQWLVLSITGSAFTDSGAPTDALLDESRQFMARLASGASAPSGSGPLVSVVLSRTIFEFYGGSLRISDSKDAPGFIVRLPVAA
jgi:signal transduction histidine kinase